MSSRTETTRLLALAILIAASVTFLHAEAVVTVKGKRIEGDIISETDDDITLKTKYGDLRFSKLELKQIVRNNPPPRKSFESFGSANPFDESGNSGGGLGTNPLFSRQDQPTANPFKTNDEPDNPFRPNAGSSVGNIFTEDLTSTAPPSTEYAGNQFFDMSGLEGIEKREITPPLVPFSWDAVLFDMGEGKAARVRLDSETSRFEEVTEDTTLRNGYIVQTLDSHARVVFKNGADMMRMAPETIIRVIESSPEKIVIDLVRGTIWFDLVSVPGNRQLFLQTNKVRVFSHYEAVFRASDALERGFQLGVISGNVEVDSKEVQMKLDVSPGHMVLVRPEGAMTPLLPADQNLTFENRAWDELPEGWWEDTSRFEIPFALYTDDTWLSMNDMPKLLGEVATAFMNFAADTGHVPTVEEAYTVLAQNTGEWENWAGPYVRGVLPPLDSWGRPLRYTVRSSQGSDRQVGIVYSVGEDNSDNGGSPSADVTEMVLYYQLESIAQNTENN